MSEREAMGRKRIYNTPEEKAAYIKAYYQKNKERIKMKQMLRYGAIKDKPEVREKYRNNSRSYYANHPDRLKASVRRWSHRNQDQLRLKARERYVKNRQANLVNARERYARNREYILAKARERYAKNRELLMK